MAGTGRTRLLLLTVLGGAAVALVTVSTGMSYGVRSLTLLVAAHALLRRGGPAGRPEGAARRCFAGALLLTFGASLAAGTYLALTGRPSPPGAVSDWIYLTYPPLVAWGLLRLPRRKLTGFWRLRVTADALVSGFGLLFVLYPLLVGMANSPISLSGRLATLAYPVGVLLVLSVLLGVIPNVQEVVRPFLFTGGAGIVLITTADIGYALANLHGTYRPTGWAACLAEGGLLLLVVAGRAPRVSFAMSPVLRGVVNASVPYLALVPGTVVIGIWVSHDEPLSGGQLVLGLLAALALVNRQVLGHVEQQHTIATLVLREREAVLTARRDPLTSLGNRTALVEALEQQLAGPQEVVLALLDLDDFKDINDRHGHDTGDALLRVVAGRLADAVPEGALLTRLGGDEFAVVLAGGDAVSLCAAMETCLERPVLLGSRSFAVTASTGVVVLAPGADVGDALAHADVAMYEAKARKLPHHSAVVLLTGAERERATHRVRLRDEISRPDLSQFRVLYEPVVDLAGGFVVGAEALLRWQHPVFGEIGPSEFIPLAEQVGSIGALGELALRTALSDLASWVEAAHREGRESDTTVGVNLSPRQLGDPGLTAQVEQLLHQYGLSPRRLTLEITEEALLDDWETAIEVVNGLRRLGVGVAVDDFGTGYSSLRYLRRFDTSIVKVDREFVSALADEPRTRALVASVLDMARLLDHDTVAEGVETLEQLRILQDLGCQFAQGYRFSRPVPAAEFGALLAAGHRYPVGTATSLPTARLSVEGRLELLA